MANESGWAQLVSTTNPAEDDIVIDKNKFTIGRAKGCDHMIADNKMVSSRHCYIEKDEQSRVWIQDTSTNGTLINTSEKLGSGKRMALNHGDEIHLVYRKKESHLNVGYIFQDLAELAKEELDATLEYTSDSEPTQQYSPLRSSFTMNTSPVKKRSAQESDECTSKRVKTTISDKNPVMTTDRQQQNSNTESVDRKSKTYSQDVSDECKQNDSTAPETLDGGKKLENQDVRPEDDKDKEGTEEASRSGLSDDFAESLTCIICQELMHDCISLQPCMHAFCAGCYSEWMERSSECPSCRMKVERINKNHIVNNLIDAYLKAHPEKKRPEDDIKELDAKNKITRDMLYPKKKRSESDDEEEGGSYSDSDSDGNTASSQSLDSTGPPVVGNLGPAMVGGLPIFTTFGPGQIYHGANIGRPPRTVCRQCPNYVDPNPPGTAATAVGRVVAAAGNVVNRVLGMFNAGDGCQGVTSSDTPGCAQTAAGDAVGTSGDTPIPGTSAGTDINQADIKTVRTPPHYVCRPGQVHILCVCCVQPMPDRRHEVVTNTNLPPMQCSICYRSFCHAYWGCRKADCLGCLSRFSEMKFGKRSLDYIILENHHESRIFREYLENKGINIQTVLGECMGHLDSGRYICTDKVRFNLTSNSVLCYSCGLRNFRDLAYHYRNDIPQDQLPDTVTSRADCYWGKNCRTQKNKPIHAERFNHICEQTRLS